MDELKAAGCPYTGGLPLFVVFYVFDVDRTLIRQMIKNVGPFNSFRALLRVAKNQVDP